VAFQVKRRQILLGRIKLDLCWLNKLRGRDGGRQDLERRQTLAVDSLNVFSRHLHPRACHRLQESLGSRKLSEIFYEFLLSFLLHEADGNEQFTCRLS
jgi:hypothetical protein